MNWKCFFGNHEWEEEQLPFLKDDLRKCIRPKCPQIEIWINDRWTPFEGMLAVYILTKFIDEMKVLAEMKTFKQLAGLGNLNQKRFDAIVKKYYGQMYGPTKRLIQSLFTPEQLTTPDDMATVLYSATETLANRIIHEMIMILYHDPSFLTRGDKE